MSVAHARSILAALTALVSVAAFRDARAQTPVGDTLPHRLRVDAKPLRGGEWVYQTTLERDNGTMILGTRTVSVAPATYAGSSAWLLLETRSGDGIPAVDSLFTDLNTVRPLHWSSTLGGARLAAEFRGDTAYVGTSAPSGRHSIIAAVPNGSLINAAMLETVLRLVPLQTAWEDSTTTISVSLSGATVLATRLSVIGDDQVRVPAGVFDCWVVAIHAESARGLYWVTKRDAIVVRSVLDVPTLGGAQLVTALTRIAR